MKKAVLVLAVLLFGLLPSTLVSNCQQQKESMPVPVEKKDGWSIFSNGNQILDLLIQGKTLWSATSGGPVIWDIDKGTYHKYTTLDGLCENTVSTVARDANGNLWLGSFYGGVSRYDGAKWNTFTTMDGLAGNSVFIIFCDEQGNVWFGTDGGVTRYDGTNWTSFTSKDGLISNYVTAITQDDKGNLWSATYGGVSRYSGTNWTTFSTRDGLASNAILASACDRKGNLWFGTMFSGISRYDSRP